MHRLELVQVESEPLAFTERLTPPVEADGQGVVSVQEVTMSGVIAPADRGFSLTGTVAGSVLLRCSRCLREFSFDFEEGMDVRLLPLAEAPQEEETRLGKGDLDVRFFTEAVVDLEEVAAEQLELALPMKPLCKEDCLGLCPRCGADHNQGRCACTTAPDSRWASLKGWRPGK